MTLSMTDRDRRRRLLATELRWLGALTLPAVVFVFAPFPWLANLSRRLGLGTLPATPIAGYLARSVSALYVLLGALALVLATEVIRYAPVVRFLTVGCAVLGVVLLGVDLAEHMPWWWTLTEGPLIVPWAIHLWLLAKGLETAEEEA